jgi:hypothetical protein
MPPFLKTCWAALALTLLANGCGGPGGADASLDAPCDLDAGATPWIELGTGEAFTPITDGDSLELFHGPQGGFHLETTARFGLAVSPDMQVLRYDVSRLDGTTLGTMQVALNERRLAQSCGHWVREGDFVMLGIETPDDVADTDVDVIVRVLDAAGEVTRAQRRVHVVDRTP